MAESGVSREAREKLKSLCTLTLFEYSDEPKLEAVTLIRHEWNDTVAAVLPTALDEQGEIDRYVTPFGDPPLTEAQFIETAEMAMNAVVAFRLNVGDSRSVEGSADLAKISQSLKMYDRSIPRSPREFVDGQVQLMSAVLGLEPGMLRVEETAPGRLRVVSAAGAPAEGAAPPMHAVYPLGSGSYDVAQLGAMLSFAEEAVVHHESVLRGIAARMPAAVALEPEKASQLNAAIGDLVRLAESPQADESSRRWVSGLRDKVGRLADELGFDGTSCSAALVRRPFGSAVKSALDRAVLEVDAHVSGRVQEGDRYAIGLQEAFGRLAEAAGYGADGRCAIAATSRDRDQDIEPALDR